MGIEEIIRKIRLDFSEEKVAGMLDEEVTGGNWLDPDWEEQLRFDGFDEDDLSPYEWYENYGRGEAEDAVTEEIIRVYERNYNSGLPMEKEMRINLATRLAEEYELGRFI